MNFHQWVQLRESMNVMVQDAPHAERLENLLDLAHALFHRLTASSGQWPQEYIKYWQDNHGSSMTLLPDGDGHFEDKGILNFYMRPVHPALREKLLQGAKYFLKDLGVQFGEFRTENNPDGTPRVVRMPILAMSPQDTSKHPPELNLSNGNAVHIFRDVLGFPIDDSGFTLSAREVLIKIDMLNRMQIQQGVRPATQQGNFYSGGLDEPGLRQRLGVIRNIAKWAIDNHYDKISVF